METMEMTRHDFAPHQRSLRKFPQRSQSLRVKSSLSMQQLIAKRSTTNQRSRMPNRLIITNQDLIIQDASQSLTNSATLARTNEPRDALKGKFSRSSLRESPSAPFKSMTLNKYESAKKRSNLLSSIYGSGSESSTLFVNCSVSPNVAFDMNDSHHNTELIPSIHSNVDIKSCSNGATNLCTTLSEDTGVEDEGVISFLTEDFEESDDEDYFDLLDEAVEHGQSRQVHLMRHPELGIGISIQGGSDFSLPVIVSNIKAGSPADTCGQIYIGDQIIQVNDVRIDDITCHKDALRLLSECGDLICLVVKHSKAVNSFRKRWRKRETLGSLINHQRHLIANLGDSPVMGKQADLDQVDYQVESTKELAPIARSSSVNCLSHCRRIDLFLAGISQYIAFSDKLRDSSFEVRTSDASSVVIQCTNEELSSQWYYAIKSAIDRRTDSFMKCFNKYYPQREHIFHMGWVSECLSNGAAAQQSVSSSGWRWLPLFIIVKGGTVYLFKLPPVSILNDFKQKLFSFSCRNHSGSSLGSVGSSGSDASNSSNSTHHTNGNAESNDQLNRVRKGKPDRLIKLNKDFETELLANSIAYFTCYMSDFRCVKPSEQYDEKGDCFVLYSGTLGKRYFSAENDTDLHNLQKAWESANYHSVIKLKNKAFTVVLEDENVFGSLIIDWQFGFSFYDPKLKIFLWSYKFCQLKHSSDDGKSRLSLTFAPDPPEGGRTITHTLDCSCLQTLIYCIHAFLSAKVYSLYL